jgi:hypothetical protein
MGRRANRHGKARKSHLVSTGGYSMGVKRSSCGPARASKSAWATGLVSRRNLIPDTRDQ